MASVASSLLGLGCEAVDSLLAKLRHETNPAAEASPCWACLDCHRFVQPLRVCKITPVLDGMLGWELDVSTNPGKCGNTSTLH